MSSPTLKAAFDGRGGGELKGEERGVNHRGSIGVRLFHLNAFFSLSTLPDSHSSTALSAIRFNSATRRKAEDGIEPVDGRGTSCSERNLLKNASMIADEGINKEERCIRISKCDRRSA